MPVQETIDWHSRSNWLKRNHPILNQSYLLFTLESGTYVEPEDASSDDEDEDEDEDEEEEDGSENGSEDDGAAAKGKRKNQGGSLDLMTVGLKRVKVWTQFRKAT